MFCSLTAKHHNCSASEAHYNKKPSLLLDFNNTMKNRPQVKTFVQDLYKFDLCKLLSDDCTCFNLDG